MIESYYIDCTKRRFTNTLNAYNKAIKTSTDTSIKGYVGSGSDKELYSMGKSTFERTSNFFSSHYDFIMGDHIIYNNVVYEVYGLAKNTANKSHHCKILIRYVEGKTEVS